LCTLVEWFPPTILPVGLYGVHSSEDSGENGRRRNPGEDRRSGFEAQSSGMRLAPSTGAQCPNGIPRPAARAGSSSVPRQRARATRVTRKNTPTATHDHAFSPSARTRQPVIRCLSRHLRRLDFLSVVIR
jgi:hypothetical protein